MHAGSEDVRRAVLARWHGTLSRSAGLCESGSLSGASPPSVFVGSHGYPAVSIGPMVPPAHGDTSLLDSPERWRGRTLDEIVGFRLGLVRGTRRVRAGDVGGRYVRGLQELAMSSAPSDSELEFDGPVAPTAALDGQSAPFGPAGSLASARFSPRAPVRAIERAFYDGDLGARDAVLGMYESGVELSRIQRCLSAGMVGRERRLVPTRWSITATDDMISDSLRERVLEYPLIDSWRVFCHSHLGNSFGAVLFPHRWTFEMTEAWHGGGGLAFGSDREDARGIGHPPAIAGAYHAARLAVLEYLEREELQAGAIVIREIRPEYAVPVGVWQVREGVREAMRKEPVIADGMDPALGAASAGMSVGGPEWLARGGMRRMLGQRPITDYA